MADIPYKFYIQSGGTPQLLPGTNTPSGAQETDFGGALNAYLSRIQNIYNTSSQAAPNNALAASQLPGIQQSLQQAQDIYNRYKSNSLTDADFQSLAQQFGGTPDVLRQIAQGQQVGSGYSQQVDPISGELGFGLTSVFDQSRQSGNMTPQQIQEQNAKFAKDPTLNTATPGTFTINQMVDQEGFNKGIDTLGLDNMGSSQLQDILKNLGSGTGNIDLNSLFGGTQDQAVQQAQQQYMDTQKKLNDFYTSFQAGQNKIEGQTIPMEFIQGQQAGLARQAQAQESNLQRGEQIAQQGLQFALQNQKTGEERKQTFMDYAIKLFSLNQDQKKYAAAEEQQKFENTLAQKKFDLQAATLPLEKAKLQAEIFKLQADAKSSKALASNGLLQAVFANPELFNQLTPTQKGALAPDLAKLGFTNFGKAISPQQQQTQANVESGLRALSTMQQEINKGLLFQASFPFSPGARTLATARNEVADVITRLRTGAALNEQEEAFYKKQMPSFLDSQDTINYKLKLFTDLFNRLSFQGTQSYGGSSGSTNSDPLGLFQ